MSKLRKSSYLISVKLNEDNKYMLVHGYTGAIDIVNEEVAEYLRIGVSFDEPNIPFSKTTLNTLIKRGYITTKSKKEETDYVRRLATLMHKANSLNKYFMFLVSYDCNFRCPYCYENEISNEGHQWSKKRFTKQMVDQAYKAMTAIEPTKERHGSVITLYGGEPLLGENREIVEYIVKKGVKLGYKFDAITNGYDLDQYLDLLHPNMIKHIQITVDGVKESHNKRRVHYSEGGSFDKIVKNIEHALQTGVSLTVRINTDATNFDDCVNLKSFFEKKGFFDYKKFSISSALLRENENLGPINNTPLKEKDIVKSQKLKASEIVYLSRKEYNERHEKMGDHINYQDYGIFNNLYASIKEHKRISFNSIFCAVQSGMYIFDPFGDIFGCWETVGMKNHTIGSYKKEIVWYDEINNWQKRNIGTASHCNQCKFAFLCGGGCMVKALRAGGDFESSYCDEYSQMFKIAANKTYNILKENV